MKALESTSEDVANESRADWQGCDGKKPPIMGRRQPIRSYMEDSELLGRLQGCAGRKVWAFSAHQGAEQMSAINGLGQEVAQRKVGG